MDPLPEAAPKCPQCGSKLIAGMRECVCGKKVLGVVDPHEETQDQMDRMRVLGIEKRFECVVKKFIGKPVANHALYRSDLASIVIYIEENFAGPEERNGAGKPTDGREEPTAVRGDWGSHNEGHTDSDKGIQVP